MIIGDTEKKLIEQASAGSEKAWQTLIKRYESMLFNHALRMVGDPDDARDLLQDVLLSVYRNLNSFRGEAPFRAWLFRIATFRCTDHLRRKRFEQAEFEETEHTAADHNPSLSLENVRSNDEIQKLLQRLPPDQRHVVELKFFQHFTFEEISRQLGISSNTAKTRLYSALRLLRKSNAAKVALGNH